jgi:hypothetical protein
LAAAWLTYQVDEYSVAFVEAKPTGYEPLTFVYSGKGYGVTVAVKNLILIAWNLSYWPLYTEALGVTAIGRRGKTLFDVLPIAPN